VIRNHTDHLDTLALSSFVGKNNSLGIKPAYPATETQEYSLGEAIPKGLSNGWNALADQGKAFSRMFKGEIRAKDSLGSIITIGREFGTTWDWKRFWSLTAMLSLILAVINLLPIPALDGGHVIFLLFEMITGIKPSDKVIEYSTLVGFILLVTLMVFALGLDISRLF
jgi:regulator of sigma E protease